MSDVNYKKGDLVNVKVPFKEKGLDLCIVTSITVPCVYRINEFFMVYSIVNKEKYITVKKFMKKIV